MGKNTLELSDANFNDTLSSAEVPVVVDFWAPWCGPCRILGPIIEELASDYQGRIQVGKLNTDESPSVASRFNIRSIPTVLFFKNGNVVDQVIGVEPKERLQKRIDTLLAK
jgi:thioredoxin 1